MSLPKALRFNYDDYCLLPDNGKRYEIIDGNLFNSPAPNIMHQRIVRELFGSIFTFLSQNKIGEVFMAPTDVVLSYEDVVQPDILYISNENGKIITEKNIQGPPDLVIEIVSPGKEKYDEEIKRKLYSKYKIKEYWVVNPELKEITKFVLKGKILKFIKKYNKEEVLETNILPGLKIKLEDVFE